MATAIGWRLPKSGIRSGTLAPHRKCSHRKPARRGMAIDGDVVHGRQMPADRCHVLDWAASGGMALTGCPDGVPAVSPAPAFALLQHVAGQLAAVTKKAGREV